MGLSLGAEIYGIGEGNVCKKGCKCFTVRLETARCRCTRQNKKAHNREKHKRREWGLLVWRRAVRGHRQHTTKVNNKRQSLANEEVVTTTTTTATTDFDDDVDNGDVDRCC